MIDRGRKNLLGVRISAVDYDAALARIADAARSHQPLAVSALAVHGVMTGVLDATHRYRLNHLDLLVPDGQPVRWALNRLYGTGLPDRVYGPALMLKACELAAMAGWPIFLFGGTEDMLAALRANLRKQFPNLQIVGWRASRFRRLNPDERNEIVTTIRSSGARITFVGLGCPRQEVWAYEFREALSMPILAVGAAFAFHAGLLPQAPPTWQRIGLEWFFRFMREPRRLWRRYVYLNPLYISLVLLQAARLRRFDPDQSVRPTEELLYG